jgi:hypothetical protein
MSNPTHLAAPPWTTRNKVGLVLAGLQGLANIPGFALPTAPDGAVGPGFEIIVVDSVLGLAAVVAVVVAWLRRSRTAARLAVGAVVLIAITALPGFFVDVPPPVKLLVAASVLVTAVAVILILTPARRPAAVIEDPR